MKNSWVFAYAACLFVGLALWRLAPPGWEWDWMQGLLLGSALYFGALRRFLVRAQSESDPIRSIGRGGILVGSVIRSVAFLAVVGAEAYLCYVRLPHADVRAGFIVCSTWLAALVVIDPPAAAPQGNPPVVAPQAGVIHVGPLDGVQP